MENLPQKGGYVLCSNHIHLLDPVIIGTCLPVKVNYMAKEELFSNRFFSKILKKLGVFPVKRGTGDISAIKTAIKLLRESNVLGIFPEGTRSKTGEIQEAKPGLAMIAIKSHTLIVPVAIITQYKVFREIKIKILPPVDFRDKIKDQLSVDDYIYMSQEVMNKIKEEITLEIGKC